MEGFEVIVVLVTLPVKMHLVKVQLIELLSSITDFQLGNLDKYLSDVHSAISVTLQLSCIASSVAPSTKPMIQNTIENPTVNVESSIKTCNFMSLKTSWDTSLKSDSINAFSMNSFESLASKLKNICNENVMQTEIDELTDELCSIYTDPTKNVSICKEHRKQAKKPAHCRNARNKPLFDGHCHQKRAEYFRVKDKLNKVKTIESKTELKNKAKEYKRVIKKHTVNTTRIYINHFETLNVDGPKNIRI